MSRVTEKVRTEVPEYLRAEKKLLSTEKDMLADEKNQQDFGTEYLSDADLETLIMQIEQQELVMAPPDLKDRILGKVQKEAKSQETAKAHTEMGTQVRYSQKGVSKKAEFRRYCFRVWTSVAAAILLIFMLPMISGQNAGSGRWGGTGDYMTNDLSQNRIEDTAGIWDFEQDILADMEENDRDFTYRDNRMSADSESILQRILGGSNLFGGEDRLNIFRENGGRIK